MKKNKWLAAILNLIPGIGYLYVGTRIPFGVLLLSMWPIGIIGGIVEPEWLNTTYRMFTTDYVIYAAGALGFVVDAYLEAEMLNKKK
jgi:hypothetical protein